MSVSPIEWHRPSGRSEQVTATVSLATLSGTWSDADGRSGSFVFGAASGGPPRPEPTASSTIVVSQLSPTVYEGTGSATTLARSDHTHDGRYYTRAEIDTRVPQTDSVTLAGGAFVARDDSPVFLGGTGCFRNNTPASGLRHTIPVTAGSTLTGLTVRTNATLASQPFTITLIRQPPGTPSRLTVISSSQTPAAVGLTTTNIPLPIPEVVDPGEAAYVVFSSSSLSAYLCAVQVHFSRPRRPVMDGLEPLEGLPSPTFSDARMRPASPRRPRLPTHRSGPVMALFIVGVLASAAAAQPLGTFRWQQQPYCNVLTINVVQTGAVYQLDGFDDQCGGAASRASVVGLAFLNPDQTIGIGLTVVTTPGATPLHIDATLDWPSPSGTWRDSSGATGAFVFTPGTPTAGSARPVPRAAFPAGLSVGGTTITNLAAPVADTDAANKGYVDAGTANARAALVNTKVWSAYVASSGTKVGSGRYTSSRTATGSYNVTFDLTGLGVLANGGFPPAVVTPVGCTGGSGQIAGGVSTSSNGVRTTVSLGIAITNAAGAATDCSFFVMLHSSDANAPNSPVPPLDTAGADPWCSTVGDVTTCFVGRRE
jgi:hypothetical protein